MSWLTRFIYEHKKESAIIGQSSSTESVPASPPPSLLALPVNLKSSLKETKAIKPDKHLRPYKLKDLNFAMSVLVPYGEQNKNIKSIDLSSMCDNYFASRKNGLWALATAYPEVVSLNLSGQDLSNVDVRAFSHFKKLENLDVTGCKLSPQQITQINKANAGLEVVAGGYTREASRVSSSEPVKVLQ